MEADSEENVSQDKSPKLEKMRAQLKEVPRKPGVYMIKDNTGEVIYVGKAKSLYNRLSSYFNNSKKRYKTKILLENADDFDYLITDNEVEAYILEANLIKKYGPKYNVQLKDDKTYPYIKVTVQEEYPRIIKSRLVKEDGARYFGPYADAGSVYRVIDTLKDLFKLRRCKKTISFGQKSGKKCLNYHIDKCEAPCTGKVNREDYQEKIDSICSFLAGNQKHLLKKMEAEMETAAENRNFERAAELRDGLEALKDLAHQQKVASGKNHNLDVVALEFKPRENMACAQLLFVRNGRIVGQDYIIMREVKTDDYKELLSSFLQQFYSQSEEIPGEILLSKMPNNQEIIQKFLSRQSGGGVELKKPQRGDKKRLVEMAQKNARQNIDRAAIKYKYEKEQSDREIKELEEYLELDKTPYYIEGFDISNLKSSDAVASLVVFKGGNPAKSMYRRFKIKDVEGQDDYAMMQEVVERRYSRLLAEDRDLPDLILIDGGKGQLNAAREVLENLQLSHLEIISLAKNKEEIYIPDRKSPLCLPESSPALQLLQRVRNEAHRFAVNYHRKLRSRRVTESMLEQIPGIGPNRRRNLLQHFGSLGQIRNATPDELKQVSGISQRLAQRIYDYLQKHTRQV